MRAVLFSTLMVFALVTAVSAQDESKSDVPAALNFKMKNIGGDEVNLAEKYDGKVVLMVNVASKCGLTPQYKQLQELHDKYSEKGLAIVGFPCNQFGRQEPGSLEEIKEFCTTKYGVKFDMMAKIDVNGDGQCDLYKHLTNLETKPAKKGKIKWNFEKFLLNKKGEVIARFGPRTKPDAKEVVEMIEANLK